ncbi:MAG: YcaO-like family protein [Pseudomonadota bacterium]
MLASDYQALSAKTHFAGTHRAVPPAETWARIQPVLPKVGITRVADITGLDCIGIPVCNAIRPDGWSLSVSQGKGISLTNARVSAAMEAIELFHAERLQVPQRRRTFTALGPGKAVDPMQLSVLPGCSDPRGKGLRWVPGHDLIAGRDVLVPRDAITCDLRAKSPTDGVLLSSSNGLASGNTTEEAAVHALCEVIERDATCLHQAVARFYRAEPCLIDLDTIDDPDCLVLLDRVLAAGVFVTCWQQISDLPVPSFGCAIWDTHQSPLPGSPIGTFQGYGCHLDPGIALSRAITEAVQSRLTYISGARDDIFRDDYALTMARRNREAWLDWLLGSSRMMDFRAIASLATDRISGDLDRLLALLPWAGFDRVVLVDLTRPDIGVPVVRAIVPGLVEPDSREAPPDVPRVRRFVARHGAEIRLLQDGLGTGGWA